MARTGGRNRTACCVFVAMLEGQKERRRRRHREDFYTKMGIKEIRREGVDWVYLAKDRDMSQAVVNTVMDLRIL